MKIIICLAAIAILWSNIAFANNDNFSPASLISASEPQFKGYLTAEPDTDSGLVGLSFMVDKDGKAYEIEVVKSSNLKFNQAAIESITNSSFQAATLNQESIDSRMSHIVEFSYTDKNSKKRSKGLPNRFSGLHEKFNTEIQRSSPSQSKSSKHLKKMAAIPNQNFYSLSYLSLAEYRYADKFGASQQKIDALEKLIEFDSRTSKKHKMLKDDLNQTVLMALLKTRLDSSNFAEFLNSYEAFSKQDKQVKQAFAQAYEKVLAISKNTESVVQRTIELPDNGSRFLPLLKRSFLVDQVKGEINNFKLRCDHRFANLPYQAGGQYDIPEKWGKCELQIVGTAGTTATLLQQ